MVSGQARAEVGGTVDRPSSQARTAPTRDEGLSVVTMGDLLSAVAGSAFHVVSVPSRVMRSSVTRSVIYDPRSPPSLGPGNIVLAIGVDADDANARDIVVQAAAEGCAAVVFKGRTVSRALVDEAEGTGVAVMTIPTHEPWERAIGAIEATIAASSASIDVDSRPHDGDLFSLADALAIAVGGAVAIEDAGAVMLAYSVVNGQVIDESRRRSILERHLDDEHREVHRVLLRSSGVVRFPSTKEERPRLAVPVRAGHEVMGQIWVIEGDGPLAPNAEQILLEGARLAALHLLRSRDAENLQRRRRSDALKSLLDGTSSPSVAVIELGLPAEDSCAVIAVRVPEPDEARLRVRQQQLLSSISLLCETIHRQAACVAVDDVLYALLPISGERDADRLIPLARRIADVAEERVGVQATVGVGSVVSLREATRSRTEADRVLNVVGTSGEHPRVASIDDVRADVILAELREVADRTGLRRGPLWSLLEQDTKGVLVPTLRAYLDCFGDVAGAAAALGVHPNTFRYRLRRVLQIVDVTAPGERLVIELQLRLLDTDR